jgi:uncharacterized membrane protein YedE/YeeE
LYKKELAVLIFISFVLILSILEIYLFKNKKCRDIIVFVALCAIAICFGLIYISNPYGLSISNFILNVFGIKH